MNKYTALIVGSLAAAPAVSGIAQAQIDDQTGVAVLQQAMKPENYFANEKLPSGCKRIFATKDQEIPVLSVDGKTMGKISIRPSEIKCTKSPVHDHK